MNNDHAAQRKYTMKILAGLHFARPRMFATGLMLLCMAGCTPPANQALNGYVEIQPVRLAAPLSGRLIALAGHEGQTLQAQQQAFTLDQDNEQHGVAEADARVQQANAQHKDLLSGRRPVELASLEAAVTASEANLRASEAELKRQSGLEGKGFVSQSTLDVLKARRDADAAQVEQAKSQLAAGRLAAREDTISAADAAKRVANEQLAQKQWLLNQKQVTSPINGRIEQIYYREGEWVPAGSPVMSLLDNAAFKVRFFIPEPRLSEFAQGKQVTLHCDGCPRDITTTISYVAKDAEFTPPVMYNNDNRAKLVWMAEARPSLEDAAVLRPGQPVDVVAAP